MKTMAKKEINLSMVLHDDNDYKEWLVELKERFYNHRLKASCATNNYVLDFYWKLGRDIEAKLCQYLWLRILQESQSGFEGKNAWRKGFFTNQLEIYELFL